MAEVDGALVLYSGMLFTAAKANELLKASSLVSHMMPMEPFCFAKLSSPEDGDVFSEEVFTATSRRQTSRDLVEEWVALDFLPLSRDSFWR